MKQIEIQQIMNAVRSVAEKSRANKNAQFDIVNIETMLRRVQTNHLREIRLKVQQAKETPVYESQE